MTTKPTAKPKSMGAGHDDNFQTPPSALEPLFPHLNKNWTVWEPAAGKRNLVNKLSAEGYSVIGTDIIDEPPVDFLTANNTDFDMILTNPPFSIKYP